MSSYLDKYRKGHISWLVYAYKGEIKVQRGYNNYGTFVLETQNRWLSKTPSVYMQISSRGKVLVDREENIPAAENMVKQFYIDKINAIESKAVTSLANIQNIITGGAV